MIDIFVKKTEVNSLPKFQFFATLILILFLSVTGSTYAYFAFSATNNTINGEAATVNLDLNVTKIFPTANSDNTGVMVPQLSVSGNTNTPLASALKNGCVDGNNNIICQVYKINIQNINGTASQVVDGSVAFYGDAAMTSDVSSTMPNLRWKLISSVDETTPSNSVLGTNEDLVADANDDNVFADNVTMIVGNEENYYMIIWINETREEQPTDEGNSFFTKISFESSNGTGVTSNFGL